MTTEHLSIEHLYDCGKEVCKSCDRSVKELRAALAQRDALLAAAEYFLDAADHSQSDPERFFNAQSALRAAIARAKGETK